MLDLTTTLEPTDVIDADHPAVRAVADDLAGASPSATAERVFTFVRDEVRYDMAPDLKGREDWKASTTLARGYGFCQQKAVVLAALLRASGIPAGLAFQDLLDHKIPERYVAFFGSQRMEVHGLAVAHVAGVWQHLDAALDSALCARKGYHVVEYETGRNCLLPATDLAGRPHFDVLDELGVYADLPSHIVERTLGLDYLHRSDYKQMVRRTGVQP